MTVGPATPPEPDGLGAPGASLSDDHGAPTRFGPYRIVRSIGSGGMGRIFEAEDTALGHRVALKLLHPHLACLPDASNRFLREARAAARVRHPHVIQILSLGTEGATPYFAMELLRGDDLSQLVARRGCLPFVEALDLFLPVVAAVGAAHDAGVIHRDLKPSNVFVAQGPSGTRWPKVLDFGVSKILLEPSEASDTGTMVGTFAYMAPEQARAPNGASARSDQYSLAVLLYQCITGSRPFAGQGAVEIFESIMTAPVLAPSARVSGLPRALDEALLRAMSRSPDHRFESVRAFGVALIAMASERTRLALGAELGHPSSPEPERAEMPDLEPSPSEASLTLESVRPRALESIASISPSLPLERPRLAVEPSASAFLEEGQVVTYDGVAAVVRGNTMAMLWQSSARIARTRWVFDILDDLAARQPDRIVVLMIILPTASPPDREARVENYRRIRRLLPRGLALSTVVLGDGIFQTLLRSVIRAMTLPHLGPTAATIEATVEGGVERLRAWAGPATPPYDETLGDVYDLFRALDLEPPAAMSRRPSGTMRSSSFGASEWIPQSARRGR